MGGDDLYTKMFGREKTKLSICPDSINKLRLMAVDHNRIESSSALQRSNFIAINTDIGNEACKKAEEISSAGGNMNRAPPNFVPHEHFFDNQLVKRALIDGRDPVAIARMWSPPGYEIDFDNRMQIRYCLGATAANKR